MCVLVLFRRKEGATAQTRMVAVDTRVEGGDAPPLVEIPVGDQTRLGLRKRNLIIGGDVVGRARHVPQPQVVQLPVEIFAGGWSVPSDLHRQRVAATAGEQPILR